MYFPFYLGSKDDRSIPNDDQNSYYSNNRSSMEEHHRQNGDFDLPSNEPTEKGKRGNDASFARFPKVSNFRNQPNKY